MRDPYMILGMPRSATSEDVKKYFRRLAKALHPDGNKDDPKAAARFAELNALIESSATRTSAGPLTIEISADGKPARHRLHHTTRLRWHIVAALMIGLLITSTTIIRDAVGKDQRIQQRQGQSVGPHGSQ